MDLGVVRLGHSVSPLEGGSAIASLSRRLPDGAGDESEVGKNGLLYELYLPNRGTRRRNSPERGFTTTSVPFMRSDWNLKPIRFVVVP